MKHNPQVVFAKLQAGKSKGLMKKARISKEFDKLKMKVVQVDRHAIVMDAVFAHRRILHFFY